MENRIDEIRKLFDRLDKLVSESSKTGKDTKRAQEILSEINHHLMHLAKADLEEFKYGIALLLQLAFTYLIPASIMAYPGTKEAEKIWEEMKKNVPRG
jgi:signal-transduction protein with cAMP-binding, CBS, and nucleotidyltransferase domain